MSSINPLTVKAGTVYVCTEFYILKKMSPRTTSNLTTPLKHPSRFLQIGH